MSVNRVKIMFNTLEGCIVPINDSIHAVWICYGTINGIDDWQKNLCYDEVDEIYAARAAANVVFSVVL